MILSSSITISVCIPNFVDYNVSAADLVLLVAGIGTYSEHEDGGILKYWSALKASVSKTIDQGVGTNFKDHVLAGYRFLMRYYEDGDDIYVFGFSRGAYTARFLSQMIFRVGLLSRGNEEMIHFAWKAFSDWLHVVGEDTPQDRERRAHMEKFQSTFCRENVQVLFLGLFDCVNSVGQFEMPLFSSTYKHMPLPPAKHIRHAVSISERRLKFKPALFSAELHQPSEDVKEVSADSSLPLLRRIEVFTDPTCPRFGLLVTTPTWVAVGNAHRGSRRCCPMSRYSG